MTVDEYIEARHQAYLALAHYAVCRQGRDDLIRRAAALGVTKAEIARILGMNRGHISAIANSEAP